MEENTIGRIAEVIKGKDLIKHIESDFKVEKTEKIQGKKIEDVMKKTKENLHPFLGHNFDEKF